MITRIEQFTKDEILQMWKEAQEWKEGIESENPVIEYAVGTGLLALMGAVIRDAAISYGFALVDFYVAACSIMAQQLINDTCDFYAKVYQIMSEHGYDEVKLEVTYSTYDVPPRNTFGGGQYEVQTKVPTVYAFHNRYGWIMM